MVSIVAIIPLWIFRYLPGSDYPNHLAIARVLWHDSSFYEPNLQATPYYLGYLFLAPAVGLLGPWVGGAIILSIFAVIFISAASDIQHTHNLHPGFVIIAPPLFFGVSFSMVLCRPYAPQVSGHELLRYCQLGLPA